MMTTKEDRQKAARFYYRPEALVGYVQVWINDNTTHPGLDEDMVALASLLASVREPLERDCGIYRQVAKDRGEFISQVRDATENPYNDALAGVQDWVSRAKKAEAERDEALKRMMREAGLAAGAARSRDEAIAAAAVMREVFTGYACDVDGSVEGAPLSVREALATTAGKALLDERDALRARVAVLEAAIDRAWRHHPTPGSPAAQDLRAALAGAQEPGVKGGA